MRKIVAQDEAVFACSKAEIYQALVDLGAYSTWWPLVVGFEVLHFEPGHIGSKTEVRPFRVARFYYEIERVKENEEICFRYSGSACRGVGIWKIVSDGDQVRARYEIDLVLQNWLMKLASMCINLSWVHSVLMKRAFRGLQKFIKKRNEVPDETVEVACLRKV